MLHPSPPLTLPNFYTKYFLCNIYTVPGYTIGLFKLNAHPTLDNTPQEPVFRFFQARFAPEAPQPTTQGVPLHCQPIRVQRSPDTIFQIHPFFWASTLSNTHSAAAAYLELGKSKIGITTVCVRVLHTGTSKYTSKISAPYRTRHRPCCVPLQNGPCSCW